MAGTWRKELIQKPWDEVLRTGFLSMASSACLCIVFRTTRPEAALSASGINEENAQQTCPQAHGWAALSQQRLPFHK